MITKLSGILEAIGTNTLVVDVNGVGYLLSASAKTLSRLPNLGSPVKVWVETLFRAEHLELIGFAEEEDRSLFKMLLTVQGVGTRVALAIQSVLTAEEIFQALSTQDKVPFTRAEGVGPKLAARLVMELKDKVGVLSKKMLESSDVLVDEKGTSIERDALAVLLRLGYRRQEASQALSATLRKLPAANLEDVVKEALQSLTKGINP